MSTELPQPGEDWKVICADTLTLLPTLPGRSVDAVVSDPPYGIDFQGEAWDGKSIRAAAADRALSDGQAFERWTSIWATECLRLLKPGGHLAAFGAPRVAHRLASGIEDAGFELRDTLMWMYGQGMPKSRHLPGGQGTALKPAYEPIILARKPFNGPAATNIEQWGTGALNIDACRIGPSIAHPACEGRTHSASGRWPANVLLGHGYDCRQGRCATGCPVGDLEDQQGGVSRFFYQAKTSRRERDVGCEQLPSRTIDLFPNSRRPRCEPQPVRNAHPTVKPIAVMRWLVRLAAPQDGLVLDPFCGSGSTGCAALLEDRRFLGIELDETHATVARARITHWAGQSARGQHEDDVPLPEADPRTGRKPRSAGRP